MNDFLYLGGSPLNEDCIQIDGTEETLTKQKEECRRYLDLLKKKFPDYEKNECIFRLHINNHDFGAYYEVVIKYNTNNNSSIEYAFFIEENLPENWE